MIHDVLCTQYPNINHKRIYRLHTAEGLSIRKRKKTKRIGARAAGGCLGRQPNVEHGLCERCNSKTWAVSRRIKCLTVADDFSHERVDIKPHAKRPHRKLQRNLAQ